MQIDLEEVELWFSTNEYLVQVESLIVVIRVGSIVLHLLHLTNKIFKQVFDFMFLLPISCSR